MKLKYYMRGVGSGILFTLFIFVVIIIPNLKLEQKINDNTNTPALEQPENDVSSLVGRNPETQEGNNEAEFVPPVKNDSSEEAGNQASDNQVSNEPEDMSEAGTGIDENISAEPDEGDIAEGYESEEVDGTGSLNTDNESDEGSDVTDEASVPSAGTQDRSDYEISNSENAIENNGAVDESTGEVKFSITKGMTSETFCKAMEKYGIIDDWKSLNGYISRHGYSSKIQIGTFTFRKGMSNEDICRKIMGKNVK